MNNIQKSFIRQIKNYRFQQRLTLWERNFVDYLSNKPGDLPLTENENNKLNEIQKKVAEEKLR